MNDAKMDTFARSVLHEMLSVNTSPRTSDLCN